MLPRAADPRTRPRIGRYLITGRIGRGGMGMVYRALDESLEREVAVKTLSADGSLDADSRRRFEVEARAAARLQHPNIVTVFELGEDRGLPFIAMEMLPGADLEALLRSGEEIPLGEKLDIVAQVCRGLAYAHERGIVHRDIKPSNIRLLDDGTAKIMDFGIAKLGGTHLTKTGMMVGTVHYMSPEQVRGQPLDGRSDVFSVGVILYELLAGERPFRGEGATQVLYKIVNEEPPPPDLAAVGELAPRLHEVLSRALAKERDARYPGAAALAEDLAAVLEELQKAQGPTPALAVEALAAAGRATPRGRGEEAVARLRGLVAAYPDFLDARRALRAALREQATKDAPAPGRAGRLPGARGHVPGRAHPARRSPRIAGVDGGPADNRHLRARHARHSRHARHARAGRAGRPGARPEALALGRGRAPGSRRRRRHRAAPGEGAGRAGRGARGRPLPADGRFRPRRRTRHRRRHERRARRARSRAEAGGAHVPQGRPPRRDPHRRSSDAVGAGGLGHAADRGPPRTRPHPAARGGGDCRRRAGLGT